MEEYKKKVQNEEKGSGTPVIAKVAVLLSVVGALLYAFLQFVWPSIVTPFASFMGIIIYALAFIPIIGWLIIPVIYGVLLVVDFIVMWGVNFVFTLAIIAGLTLGITALLSVVKKTGKGKVLSWTAVIISGIVLLSSFLFSLANLIITIVSVFGIFILLSAFFPVIVLLSFLGML